MVVFLLLFITWNFLKVESNQNIFVHKKHWGKDDFTNSFLYKLKKKSRQQMIINQSDCCVFASKSLERNRFAKTVKILDKHFMKTFNFAQNVSIGTKSSAKYFRPEPRKTRGRPRISAHVREAECAQWVRNYVRSTLKYR